MKTTNINPHSVTALSNSHGCLKPVFIAGDLGEAFCVYVVFPEVYL